MRRRLLLALLAGAVTLGAGTVAFASSVGGVTAQRLTFWSGATSIAPSSCNSTATQDSYIDEQRKNTTHGNETNLDTGFTGAGKAEYVLVEFSPCAPANAKIVSATLQMTLTASPGSVPYGVFPMTGSWPELTNWNTSSASVGGSVITTTTASGGTVSWSLTSSVQAIVNGGSNNGWAIEDTSGTAETSSFDSREAGSNRPTLVLSYYP